MSKLGQEAGIWKQQMANTSNAVKFNLINILYPDINLVRSNFVATEIRIQLIALCFFRGSHTGQLCDNPIHCKHVVGWSDFY